MVERISHQLNFPKDHYTHDTPVEWVYFWGRFSEKEYFHFASFKVEKPIYSRATHWSIHDSESKYFEELSDDFKCLKYNSTYIAKGDLFSIQCKHFGLHMTPNCKPIIHKVLSYRNYYSIPSMKAEGFIYPDKKVASDVWMDHEFGEGRNLSNRNWMDYEFGEGRNLSNWDWVGIKLDCGPSIMVFSFDKDKCCSFALNGDAINLEFILEGKHLFIYPLGSYFILEPLVEEKIFDPEFGIKYSEQPFEVVSKGGVIGYGMRERTYHGMEVNKNGKID